MNDENFENLGLLVGCGVIALSALFIVSTALAVSVVIWRLALVGW